MKLVKHAVRSIELEDFSTLLKEEIARLRSLSSSPEVNESLDRIAANLDSTSQRNLRNADRALRTLIESGPDNVRESSLLIGTGPTKLAFKTEDDGGILSPAHARVQRGERTVGTLTLGRTSAEQRSRWIAKFKAAPEAALDKLGTLFSSVTRLSREIQNKGIDIVRGGTMELARVALTLVPYGGTERDLFSSALFMDGLIFADSLVGGVNAHFSNRPADNLRRYLAHALIGFLMVAQRMAESSFGDTFESRAVMALLAAASVLFKIAAIKDDLKTMDQAGAELHDLEVELQGHLRSIEHA